MIACNLVEDGKIECVCGCIYPFDKETIEDSEKLESQPGSGECIRIATCPECGENCCADNDTYTYDNDPPPFKM